MPQLTYVNRIGLFDCCGSLKRMNPRLIYFTAFGFFATLLVFRNAYSIFAGTLVAGCIWCIARHRSLEATRQDRIFAILLTAFPLSMAPSAIFMGGDWSAFDYPLRALIFVLLIAGLRSTKELTKLEFYIYSGGATGGIGAAIFTAISMFLEPAQRVGIPITNPIAYGQIAGILSLLSLAGWLKSHQRTEKIFYGLGGLGAIFAIYGSGSAGALLGWLAGLTILMAYTVKRVQPTGRKALYLALFSCIAVGILFPLAAQKYSQILNEVQATLAGEGMGTSQGQRLILLMLAIKSFAQYPWLGVGPGNTYRIVDAFCNSNYCTPQFTGFTGMHSQYLDAMTSAGVLGLAGWLISSLGIFILFISRASARPQDLPAIIGAAIVASMLASSTTQGLYHHNISVISYYFTISLLWFLTREPNKEAEAATSCLEKHKIENNFYVPINR
jgi:O-antigen ligase